MMMCHACRILLVLVGASVSPKSDQKNKRTNIPQMMPCNPHMILQIQGSSVLDPPATTQQLAKSAEGEMVLTQARLDTCVTVFDDVHMFLQHYMSSDSSTPPWRQK
jgi:hypothetical protein